MSAPRPPMLDTNAASVLIRGGPASLALERSLSAGLCISVITEAELRFGVARKPEATRLAAAVHTFLQMTRVLPFTSATAAAYASLRFRLSEAGLSLSAMDLLIAAHAVAEGCVLISADRAFDRVPGLTSLDWTRSPNG